MSAISFETKLFTLDSWTILRFVSASWRTLAMIAFYFLKNRLRMIVRRILKIIDVTMGK